VDELRLSLSNQWLGFKGVDLMVVIFSLYLFFFFFFEVKQKLEMKKDSLFSQFFFYLNC
jgi:hypothetical protein